MINKKWRKDASDNAIDALMRVGGCALSSILLKKVTDANFTSKSNINKTIGNLASPTVALLGLAGDIFLDNKMLRALCQGMYTYAVPKTVAQVAPAIGAYMGLNGVPAILHGTPAILHGTQFPALPAAAPQYATAAATPAQAAMMAVAQNAAAAPAVEPEEVDAVGALANSMLISH